LQQFRQAERTRRQVVKIIQHQQHGAVCQCPAQGDQRVLTGGNFQVERIGNGQGNLIAPGNRMEGDEENSIRENSSLFAGSFHRQPGFTNSAGSQQGEHPAVWLGDGSGNFFQLAFPPGKGSGKHGQIKRRLREAQRQGLVAGGVPADLLHQGNCLGGGFQSQLFLQVAAAGGVLCHGCAPLAFHCQQAHPFAVQGFIPGCQCQQLFRQAGGFTILPPSFQDFQQQFHCLDCLLVGGLAHQQQPFVKSTGIGQRKGSQEGTPVKCNCRPELAKIDSPVGAPVTSQQVTNPAGELMHIHVDVLCGIPLNSIVHNQQAGDVCGLQLIVAQCLAQRGKCLPQAVHGGIGGLVFPQQASQGFPGMRVLVFHQKVCQQGAHFIRPQGKDGSAMQRDLHDPEEPRFHFHDVGTWLLL